MVPPLPFVDLLAELLQGFRRPAVATDDRGAVVYMNAAAVHEVERQPGETTLATPKDWPTLVTIKSLDGQAFDLRCPAHALDVPTSPEQILPPRLAKVATLVIGGLTDKQIAQRLGLTFSTVRTYVRQVYRRLEVHNRVALVHATTARPVEVGEGEGEGPRRGQAAVKG